MLFGIRIFSFKMAMAIAIVFSTLCGLTLSTSASQASDFEYQGVVEGFYGSFWTHQERRDMIEVMGRAGLSDYFYAPKDDPYHRSQWREPYEGEWLEEFEELLAHADEHDVNIHYALSPGLDMEYSSEEDFGELVAKFESMYELGVRHFALFLDDVPQELQHDEDIEAFDDLAEAHVEVINRLNEWVNSVGAELTVCPTTYTNSFGDRDYVRKLGEGVDSDVPMFWTGTDVAVAEITADETADWGELMQRKPLIWDNFPVNDFESWRIFLAPLSGRDAGLTEQAAGIISNPMNEPYASMIGVYTVGLYAQNPAGYEPEEALQTALSDLYGERAAEALMPVVDFYSAYGWEDHPLTPVFTPGLPVDYYDKHDKLNQAESALDEFANLTEGNHLAEGLGAELDDILYYTRDELVGVQFRTSRVEEEGLWYTRRNSFKANSYEQCPDAGKSEIVEDNWYQLDHTGHDAINGVARMYECEDRLHLVIRLRSDDPIYASEEVYGDHSFVVLSDQIENRTNIDDSDVILKLVPERGDEPRSVTGYEFTGDYFARRGIRNVEIATFTPFFMEFMEETELPEEIDITYRQLDSGYQWEITIDPDFIRPAGLNIGGIRSDEEGEARRFHLSEEAYFGNPAVFPAIDY